MKRMILTGALALAAGLTGLMAQQPAAPAGQPAAPAAPAGPRAQSADEGKAVQALAAAQNTGNPDNIVQAAEDLLTRFADTQFKELALTMEAAATQMKGDAIKSQMAWERVVQANPKSVQGNLKVGELIVGQTNEKALDRDEKLAQGEKYLNATLALLKDMPKPNAGMTDKDWDAAKLTLDAEAHNSLGMAALFRKKYDVAIAEFQTAVKEDATQQAYAARLATAYQSAGKNAESIAECDRLLALPDLNPTIKNFVTNVKAVATKASGK